MVWRTLPYSEPNHDPEPPHLDRRTHHTTRSGRRDLHARHSPAIPQGGGSHGVVDQPRRHRRRLLRRRSPGRREQISPLAAHSTDGVRAAIRRGSHRRHATDVTFDGRTSSPASVRRATPPPYFLRYRLQSSFPSTVLLALRTRSDP